LNGVISECGLLMPQRLEATRRRKFWAEPDIYRSTH
jgi:hypothetical protein